MNKMNTFNDKELFIYYGSSHDSSFLYKKVGIDSPADILYTKYLGEEAVYVPDYDIEYFRGCSKMSAFEMSSLYKKGRSIVDAITFLAEQTHCSRIIIPGNFPLWIYLRLNKEDREISVKDYYFTYSHVIKNNDEFSLMRKNATLAKKSFRFIETILRKSSVNAQGYLCYQGKLLSSKKLIQYLHEFMIKRGFYCEFPIIACGKQSFHGHPSQNHLLKGGEPIVIDLSYKDLEHGYFTDLTRTYFKGYAKNINLLHIYEALISIKKESEVYMRPGIDIDTFSNVLEERMHALGIILQNQEGMEVKGRQFICHHSLGHGIGKNLHELPVINSRAKVPFEKGMTVAIEPGAYRKDIGGVRIEDTYYIDSNGCLNLTGFTSPIIIP